MRGTTGPNEVDIIGGWSIISVQAFERRNSEQNILNSVLSNAGTFEIGEGDDI